MKQTYCIDNVETDAVLGKGRKIKEFLLLEEQDGTSSRSVTVLLHMHGLRHSLD
jgi:hypothetical protein